ncbi:UDP-glycosyltransferase 3 [Melia azedarach]|uniref:UDP-glycosyltransferase 3 n=1 Tax=Melia azedarach TaxID=155640 RepID=A0ACC1Y2J6_MELAZ|nr:UDP-glycosyltransferase 3 [Melia azedarach]
MSGQQTQSSNGQHVAVLAFPFGSHALTISSLMIKLASAAPNLEFSFFSTKKSNDSLFPASKNNLPDNVRVYDIEDGLPNVKHASAVNDPLMFVELFLKAAPENFRRGLELAAEETGRKISCLITDIFLTFSEEIAGNMNVPWIPLSVAMPYGISAHIYTDLIRQLCIKCDNTNTTQLEEQTLDVIPGLSMMRVSDVPDEILLSDSLFASTLSKFGVVLPKATAIVVNFFLELYSSSQLENDLKSKFPTMLNVGFLTQPMPPPPLPPSHSDETGCLRWLDGKKAKSVAYISFGTVATPPPDELMALAEALEESGIHFLWSLRDDKLCLLPENFLERTTNCGKIVPRAPQTQVLGHSSTGCICDTLRSKFSLRKHCK